MTFGRDIASSVYIDIEFVIYVSEIFSDKSKTHFWFYVEIMVAGIVMRKTLEDYDVEQVERYKSMLLASIDSDDEDFCEDDKDDEEDDSCEGVI